MKTPCLTFTALALLVLVAACTSTGTTPASTPPVATTTPPAITPDGVPEVLTINADQPGATVKIREFVVPGQITVFDFYSEYCPPCMRIAPVLAQLAADRPDLVVRKVDINRPGVVGIDWASPVAQQYGLHSIPHFKIYAADGSLMAEGDPAFELLLKWAGIQ